MTKKQLDIVSTILGVIAGVSTVLTSNGYLNKQLGGSITGISTVLLGVIIQRPAKKENLKIDDTIER